MGSVANKMHQIRFRPAGGAHDAPPDPLVGWGGDTPSPFPTSTPTASRSQRLWRLELSPPATHFHFNHWFAAKLFYIQLYCFAHLHIRWLNSYLWIETGMSVPPLVQRQQLFVQFLSCIQLNYRLVWWLGSKPKRPAKRIEGLHNNVL